MIHVAASRVFKRPKRPSAVDKAVGAVNINFPFSMQGQNRAEKVSSKALDRYSALLLARILREVDIIPPLNLSSRGQNHLSLDS